MVALFGTDQTRDAARIVWRTARNAVNDFFRDLDSRPDPNDDQAQLLEHIKAAAAQLGTTGEKCLDACRADLQVRNQPA